jgi:hypothetical protein
MHNTAQSTRIEPVVEVMDDGREDKTLASRMNELDADGGTEGGWGGCSVLRDTMGFLFVVFLSFHFLRLEMYNLVLYCTS